MSPTHWLRAVPIALAALVWLLPAPATAEGPIALVNVRVVNTDPSVKKALKKRQTVLVEAGVITAIGKASQVEVPDGAEVIDGRNKLYVLPGLADLHTHSGALPGLPEKVSVEELYSLYLANGVTTILDMSGFPKALRWRRDLRKGKLLGPNLHVASPIIDEAGYGSSLEAVEADIRKFARDGYDYIKSHTVTTPAFFERVHQTAREVGVPVVGHALRPGFPIQDTIAQEPWMIAHIEEILSTSLNSTAIPPEEQLEQPTVDVAASRAWVTGTLAVYEAIADIRDDATFEALADRPEMQYLPPSIRDIWIHQNRYRRPDFGGSREFWRTQLGYEFHIAKRLRQLGSLDRLLLGTDTGVDMVVPGFSIHDELRLFVEAGLKPREAIQTGTYNAAAFLGELDEAGTVEVGKRADLLVVKKNPLKKIGRLADPAGVLVAGVWLDEAELEAKLAALAARWVE